MEKQIWKNKYGKKLMISSFLLSLSLIPTLGIVINQSYSNSNHTFKINHRNNTPVVNSASSVLHESSSNNGKSEMIQPNPITTSVIWHVIIQNQSTAPLMRPIQQIMDFKTSNDTYNSMLQTLKDDLDKVVKSHNEEQNELLKLTISQQHSINGEMDKTMDNSEIKPYDLQAAINFFTRTNFFIRNYTNLINLVNSMTRLFNDIFAKKESLIPEFLEIYRSVSQNSATNMNIPVSSIQPNFARAHNLFTNKLLGTIDNLEGTIDTNNETSQDVQQKQLEEIQTQRNWAISMGVLFLLLVSAVVAFVVYTVYSTKKAYRKQNEKK